MEQKGSRQMIERSQRDIRKEALARQVLYALEKTIIIQGVTPETRTDEVLARLTDDSARIIGTLVEAVDILEEIIFASDGCIGHQHCAHSMEPWQRARALLRGKWEAWRDRSMWP